MDRSWRGQIKDKLCSCSVVHLYTLLFLAAFRTSVEQSIFSCVYFLKSVSPQEVECMSKSLILSAPCCGKCQRHVMTNATALLFHRQEHQLPVTQTGGVYYQGSTAGFYPNPYLWKKKCLCVPFVAEMKTKINDLLFLSLTCKVKLIFHSVIMSNREKYTPSEVMVSSGKIR